MEEKSQKKTNIALIVIIILLLLAFIVVVIKMSSSIKEKDLTYQENLKIKDELNELMLEYNNVKADNVQFQSALSEKDSIILANSIEINKLLASQSDYRKIQKKLDILRGITQEYVSKIDSLILVNDVLVKENTEIKHEIVRQKEENKTLTQKSDSLNQKITDAAVLKAYNIYVAGKRQKGRQEVETNDEKKIEKILISFTIGENKVVPNGEKNIYIRIARPDGEILTRDNSDASTFVYKGERLQYSLTKSIYYDKSAQDLSFVWLKADKKAPAMKGTYEVSIYADDVLIGEGRLILE